MHSNKQIYIPIHNIMGQFQGKTVSPKESVKESIRRRSDHVFDRLTSQTENSTLSFQELYAAVLLVFNDLNKHFPGPHYDPPPREEVYKMFLTFDKNKDNELSKEEFAQFMEIFTSKLVLKVGRNFLIFSLVAPAVAFLMKQATEHIPRVGKIVRKIPTPVYASLITGLVLLIERKEHKKELS